MEEDSMTANSIDRYPTRNAARISLALLLTVLLVFPDLALAQEPTSPCTTGSWTALTTTTLAPPGSPSYYGVETFASAVATVTVNSTSTTYLYAIGGMNCNTSSTSYGCNTSLSTTFQTQVGHATLDPSTGALGPFSWQNLWIPTTPGETLPVGLGRDLCGAIYTNPAGKNYLYTVGGLAFDQKLGASALTNEIWYAQIYPNNGSLLQWREAKLADGKTPYVLPSALDLEGVAVLNGYLYVIGGTKDGGAGGLTSEVWSAQLNSSTGNLVPNASGGAFTLQQPIEKATGGIYKTCPVAFNSAADGKGYIYVAGGETHNGPGNPPGTTVVSYSVQAATGGVLSAWASVPPGLLNNPLKTDPLASQAVVYNSGLNAYNGIILMGGDTTGMGPDTGLVELGTISSPSAISWSVSDLASLSPALSPLYGGVIERNSGATNGNFIYSLGGEVTSNKKTSDSPAIYCLEL
jgi:hypothetical protein